MLRLAWALLEAFRLIFLWLWQLPLEAAIALGGAGPNQERRPKRLWLALAVILPVALAAALVLPRITLVMSPSIDAWALREAPGPIVRGDFVRFTLRHPIAGAEPVSVTKLALCLPGDRLTKVEVPSMLDSSAFDGRFFCNGRFLGMSLPRDRFNKRLAHMMWSGVVPPGMIYVGSHHPRGFDSRYFGLVPIEKLTRMTRIL
jgi:type IV secretory pathway protease TraF